MKCNFLWYFEYSILFFEWHVYEQHKGTRKRFSKRSTCLIFTDVTLGSALRLVAAYTTLRMALGYCSII